MSIYRSELYGGDGGEPFDQGVRNYIVEFGIRSGAVVDSVSILYDGAARATNGGEKGENNAAFNFQPDEYITEVTVQHAKVVVGIAFKTNLGRSFDPCEKEGMMFLGRKGDETVVSAPQPGYAVRGIFGREGKYLDAIGFHWGPAVPRS